MSAAFLTGKGHIEHPALGRVLVTVRPQAKQFIGRWKPDGLHVTVPAYTTYDQLMQALQRMAPQLIAKRPAAADWSHGRVYDFGDIIITIRHEGRPGVLSLQTLGPGAFSLLLGSQPDLQSDSLRRAALLLIDRLGEYEGQRILLPLAAQIANELGCHPRGWKIGRGRRKLGHCTPRGEIMLSGVLCFYPPELRRYIICHELAHLTEMNHSPRFHALCNHYCQGNAPAWERLLKTYKPPF